MAMLLHVRAEAGCAAFQLHLTDQAAFREGIEAVVNRRVRNLRHRLLGADKNFLGGRMVALVQDYVINMLALGREPKAAGAQPFGQVLLGFAVDASANHE
jgi:hypothetical protein